MYHRKTTVFKSNSWVIKWNAAWGRWSELAMHLNFPFLSWVFLTPKLNYFHMLTMKTGQWSLPLWFFILQKALYSQPKEPSWTAGSFCKHAALDCRETPAAAVENANTTGELGARVYSGFISGLVETLSCETPVFSQLKRLRGGYETDLTGLMEAAAPSGLKRKTGFQHVVDVNVCTQVKDLLWTVLQWIIETQLLLWGKMYFTHKYSFRGLQTSM